MTSPTIAPPPATRPAGIRLPVYRLRLVSLGSENVAGVWTWHGSAWREERSDLLGGERSVWTLIRAVWGRSEAQATAWTRLYWRVRDATGWPLTRDRVPAGMLHDVTTYAELFDRLAAASWCFLCHGAPSMGPHGLCAWCSVAPIGRLWLETLV